MLNTEKIGELHSVRFRSKGFKRKRMLKPDQERTFLNFLIRALGENVFLVSTGLGLDIYYLSSTNHTLFIAKNLWLFRPESRSEDGLFVHEEHTGKEVLGYFNTAVESLSGHPQLFLSCCKKLISQFNAMGIETPLNQLLYNCFDAQLNRLIKEERLPFVSKIEELRHQAEKPFLKSSDGIKRLAKQYMADNHIN